MSFGAWFFGSLIVSSLLTLGLYFGYRTRAAIRYGDSDLQKYAAAMILFCHLFHGNDFSDYRIPQKRFLVNVGGR